jgi:hypothetical protein
MPDEHPLTLRQANQACADFAAIADELNFIQAQLARLPTRKEIRAMIKPYAVSAPAPPQKKYEPPSRGRYRSRR